MPSTVPDAAPFLAAIRAAPDDDAPRLIYADWLDEHGQPERAEFIRVQCELARRESPELRRREAELLAQHHDALAGNLYAPGIRLRFERGLAASFGHKGFFWATEGRGRSQMTTLLQFASDGVVLGTVSALSHIHLIRWISRVGGLEALRERGTYYLDPFCTPVGIRFSLSTGANRSEYEGTFEGGFLDLRVSQHSIQDRQLRQRFTQVSIEGFDSFQES